MRFLKAVMELVVLLLLFGVFVEAIVEPLRKMAVEAWIQRTTPYITELARHSPEFRFSQNEKLAHRAQYLEARGSIDIALVQAMRTLTCSNDSPGRVEYERFFEEGEEKDSPRIVSLLHQGEKARRKDGQETIEFSGKSTEQCLQLRYDIHLSPLLPFLSTWGDHHLSSGNIFLPCS